MLAWPHFGVQSRKKRFVPLGLLKIGGYHLAQGDRVQLVRQMLPRLVDGRPDRIYVSSLFTYDREPVIRAVHQAMAAWPGVEIQIGGVWASLMPDNVLYSTGVQPHVGLLDWAEDVRPAWELWPGDTSVVFASRGCTRQCPWCMVAAHDGPGFRPRAVDLVIEGLDLERPRVNLLDSNLLAHPQFFELAERLIGLGKVITVEQGFDARLVTAEVVAMVRRMKVRDVWMSYDQPSQAEAVERAIRLFREAGQSWGHIHVFVLYGFYDPATGRGDRPEEIHRRIEDVLRWGAIVYPMRYRPVDSTDKVFISPYWGWDALRRFNEIRMDFSRGRGIVCRSLRGEEENAPKAGQ